MSNVPSNKPRGKGGDPEVVYFWFKSLAGSAELSWESAVKAKAVGIPRHRSSWYDMLNRYGMRERYIKERNAEHAAKHAEREAMHQSVLDDVAIGFEEFLAQYGKLLKSALKAIVDKGDQAGLLLLRSDFAFGVEQFDRLFRMYLRALGKPEKISHVSGDMRQTIIFETLTPEEKQKLLKRKDGVIPQPKNPREALRMEKDVKLMMGDDDEDV